MKLVKTSAIAVALLAGPVLAQGASSDTKVRGSAPGKTQMQGGAAGDEDAGTGATGHKTGAAKTGAKGTVGTGSGKVTSGGAMAPATGR